MPEFRCQVCDTSFSLPQDTLDKYPGWQPKFCRAHSPKRGGGKAGARGGKKRGNGAGRGGAVREECLTLDEVRARYSGGPQSGVFTDGSARPNPGPGGWGVVWVEDGEVVDQRHGHEPDTTNNRMELRALVEAYALLPEDAEVTVHTDSNLCAQTVNEWAPVWESKGWKKRGGPIKNLELVQELLALHRAHPRCKIVWIAAHSGHLWNEYADSLATAWMRDEL